MAKTGPKPQYSCDQLREAIARFGSMTAAAKSLGISTSTISARLSVGKNKPENDPPKIEPIREGLTADLGDKCGILTGFSKTIRSLDDLLAAGKVDTAIWEVERYTLNKWDVVAKIAGPEESDWRKKLAATELWQVKAWLRRKVERSLEIAYAGVVDRLKEWSPAYKPAKTKAVSDPHMLEVSIFDIHFGKLAWRPETGNDYDLKIAEEVYLNAVRDLANKARGFPIEKVLMPVGSDFFHIDSSNNETTRGTRQDVDSRWAKIFLTGYAAMAKAIDFLRLIAPVQVVWVPGNHDHQTSWHLATLLKTHYSSAKNVTVDNTPTTRKYVKYGLNLIGFTHGDKEKSSTLPLNMAGSVPKLWAETKYREWHTGHYHKRKEERYTAMDTHDAIAVRVLPSLSGTDAWHYGEGYVNGLRIADAFLWSRQCGLSAVLSSTLKPE